jgi:hypothetical protein
MEEVASIAPVQCEPGLIAYECPSCRYVTSTLTPAHGETAALRVVEFRKQAEESFKRAESAASSSEKKHWLEVAARWLGMAAAEESRNEGDPPPP